MKVVLGAPVAERAWILPRWWECLERQTLRPDEYRFVLSPSEDETQFMLAWPDMGPSKVYLAKQPFYPRTARQGDPKDPHRAKHFSELRNRLKTMFMQTDADVFVSLDTDILLQEPTALEQLVGKLTEGWDLASPLTYLHPHGPQSECYNAGFWTAALPGDPKRPWRRAEKADVLIYHSPIQIHVPMAAYAITRHAMGMCKYSPFECGEDLGFADSLDRHNLRCAWLTDLYVPHVWGPQWLEQETTAA